MSAGGQNSKTSSSAPSDPSAVVEHTRHLLSISLAESTKKMYGVGWRSYIQYCVTANRKPVPLSEEALMNWASNTALSGCKYTTIKSYMSINRLMQVNVEAPSEHVCSSSKINSIIMRNTNRSTFLHKVWCVLVEV